MPYSVEEIYGLHESGKYHDTRKVYQEMYRIYSMEDSFPIEPEMMIIEDSNSGYDFFCNVCEDKDIACLSAGGKLLTDRTKDTYLQYNKTKLNSGYLHEEIRKESLGLWTGSNFKASDIVSVRI